MRSPRCERGADSGSGSRAETNGSSEASSNPTLRAAHGDDLQARLQERFDVAQHGSFGDLELGSQLAGRHPATRLEQPQHRDQSAGAHRTQGNSPITTEDVVIDLSCSRWRPTCRHDRRRSRR